MSEPWILGIASSHNGAACVLYGSRIVVAIQEERLLRYKRAECPGAYPSLAVAYCLRRAGIQAKQLDAVAICSTEPSTDRREDLRLNSQLRVGANGLQLFVVPHHLGHAVAVHALSGAPSSAVLVVDGNGSVWSDLPESERAAVVPGQYEAANVPGRTMPCEHASLYVADHGAITPIEKHVASYSNTPVRTPGLQEFCTLGHMYSCVGKQIFGSFFEGPGKVMGLAPYGTPVIPVEEFYRVTPVRFEFQDAVRARFPYDEPWPAHEDEYRDLAASVQRALEQAILRLCARLRRAHDVLGYAGGVALNSVANERIVRECGFRDVFIMPAAEDSGTAIGAAYHALWQLRGYAPVERQQLDATGRSYADADIRAAIGQLPGLRSVRSSSVVDETADLLAQGKIVGWFQDGSELGPRALGQRSILCDPRPVDMKDVLNRRVKFREGFRPFAPIVREEDVHEWFELDQEAHRASPFMLRVMRFRPEQAARVPAVVHADGTGRVQTVSRRWSPRLHRLLSAFKERTGIPVILNTSFNIAGEPIVETPADALWCFLYTGIDHCVVGDHVVSKPALVDIVLDLPLSVTVHALYRFEAPSNRHRVSSSDAIGTMSERTISAQMSRMTEIAIGAFSPPWLRVIIVVPSSCGWIVHGLSGGLANILSLIDGRQTGREIHSQLADAGSACSLDQFRWHLGLLRRVGAIGFSERTTQVASVA